MEEAHYGEDFFAWQQHSGRLGPILDAEKFAGYSTSDDRVLDFGCGGAFMLESLPARERMGIEINPSARRAAHARGLNVVESTAEVPDGWADVIISDNALEHTHHPLTEISALRSKLRSGGCAVFVVPCETLACSYAPNDINQHLYSWSPMNIGNLFSLAGYEVVNVTPMRRKWPPKSEVLLDILGPKLMRLLCRVYGHIDRRWSEVRVVAKAP